MRSETTRALALLLGGLGACTLAPLDETGKVCSSEHSCGPGWVCGVGGTCVRGGAYVAPGRSLGDGGAPDGGAPDGGAPSDAGSRAPDAGRCPAGLTCFIEDTFARPNQAGWGTTTNTDGVPNVAWSFTGDGGLAPYVSIQGDTGFFGYPGATGVVGIMSAGTSTFAGGDALARVSVSAVGHAEPYISLNACPDDSCYYALKIYTNLNEIHLSKAVGGSNTHVALIPFTAQANTPYWMRVDFDENTKLLSGKVWADGTPEPSAWMLQYSDADGGALGPNRVGAGGTWAAAGPGELYSYTCYSFAAPGYGPAAPCGQVQP